MSHPTQDQVARIFENAPSVLRQLARAGVENPSFQLFADGSGTLWLGDREDLTEDQLNMACTLVRSSRGTYNPTPGGTDFGITFCYGMVDHEEENAIGE